MGKVGCFVGWASLLVGCLVGLVMVVYMSGVVKKIKVTLGFGLQAILVESLGVSVPCKFQLSRGTLS